MSHPRTVLERVAERSSWSSRTDSLRRDRAALGCRLEARRQEMEGALLARVYGISDPDKLGDPRYIDGLRAALTASVDYAFRALERNEDNPPAVPTALLSQARLAAQSGLSLDIVLRRYVAGFALLSDFVLQEATECEPRLGTGTLQSLLRTHSALLDRLLEAVSDEFQRASEELRAGSSAALRLGRVRRLLAGELPDTSQLGYPIDGWHLAVAATGAEVPSVLRDLATSLDRILLLVQPDEDTVWAWLGGRRPVAPDLVIAELSEHEDRCHFGIGECGQNLSGWRLSHRQAAAVLSIAQRRGTSVRYADASLLATALKDDLLSASLRQIYLEPLRTQRDAGEVLKETLRAYIAANRNLSSAATALSVSRRTISNRLSRIENLVGRPLPTVMGVIDTALQIDQLENTDHTSHIGPIE